MAIQVASWRAPRAAAPTPRVRRLFTIEHAALAAALASGCALLVARGWSVGQIRWLSLKVGLIVFLLVPLEGFHAYVCHVWIPAAQRSTAWDAERRLERGMGMEEMIRTLGIPLLGIAVPLIVWLSLRKPF